MRRWQLLPMAMIAAVLVLLPVAALTDSGLEQDFRKAAGLNTGECEPATNLDSPWRSGPDLPFPLDELRAATVDGEVYLVGGTTDLEELPNGRLLLEPTDVVLRFDPRTEEYEEMAPLPRPLNHIGVVAYGHRLYAVGGYGRTLDRDTSRALYRYDPARDRWTRLPDAPAGRAAMAAAVIGDRLIVAGGALDEVPVSDVVAFDFRTERWSRLPKMPDRREHVGAAALGDQLYVLGGRTGRRWAVEAATRYDAGAGSWTRLPPLPVGSGGLAVVAANGRVIALGGGNDGAGTVTGAVQQWIPGDDRWTRLPDMRTPRHGHAAAVAAGKIWAFGGSDCAYFAATDDVEWLPVPGRAG